MSDPLSNTENIRADSAVVWDAATKSYRDLRDIVQGTISLPGNRTIQSDGSGKALQASEVTSVELGYLSGTQNSLQDQIDDKAATTYVDEQLTSKADQATTYTKLEVNDALAPSRLVKATSTGN